MRKALIIGAILLALPASTGWAQDELGEVVVTGQRASQTYYTDEQPVIGLRRQADSAVQSVAFTSDSRDEQVRKREIHAMLLAAIDRAGSAGVELVTGDFELVSVTRANYADQLFQNGNRPDTSVINLMVKARLAGSTGSAQKRIDDFVRAVPPSGRALLEKRGSLTLTIINPDQYRDEIVRLVADGAKKSAGFFGPEYGVDVTGLDQELAWAQISGTEVFLYIPYRFSIKPK